MQTPSSELAAGRPHGKESAHQQATSFICCCAKSIRSPSTGEKSPYTKAQCEAQRNMQFPKKVIWHPAHGDTPGMCCYKNRLTCVQTLFGVIPLGMHGKGKSASMCEEGGDGELVDYADKTMAVNKVMVTLQHAAGKAMLNKAKGIVTVGLAPAALDAGVGIEMDGGHGSQELTVNDVRNDVEAVRKVKKACGGEDLSGTTAQCEMMFDKKKDKAYLLLPPKVKEDGDGKEEGIAEEGKEGDGEGSADAYGEKDATPDAEGDSESK